MRCSVEIMHCFILTCPCIGQGEERKKNYCVCAGLCVCVCVAVLTFCRVLFAINKMIITSLDFFSLRKKKTNCIFLRYFIDYHREMQWVEARLFIFSLTATNTVSGDGGLRHHIRRLWGDFAPGDLD